MGLLVTLFLISANVYGNVKAPYQRGFSYLEIWAFGTQGIILLAILEYGIVLAWKKYGNEASGKWMNKMSKDEQIKQIDMIFLCLSLLIFLCFSLIYWAYCLSL